MKFNNVYSDTQRAISYARLEFPGTYYLAYRDLPKIILKHTTGQRSLDLGCGTGRSTRFLKNLGFECLGVDIAPEMIKLANETDPKGDYKLLQDANLQNLGADSFNLITAIFTFDNIPTVFEKLEICKQLNRLLADQGTIVNLVSAPWIYYNEWASFSTFDFPQNRHARSGDQVKIIMKDVPDKRPVEDIMCDHEQYIEIYAEAKLKIVGIYKPLGRPGEPVAWVNETRIPPWVIYVLAKNPA